jgi:hypothetical protein
MATLLTIIWWLYGYRLWKQALRERHFALILIVRTMIRSTWRCFALTVTTKLRSKAGSDVPCATRSCYIGRALCRSYWPS